MFMEFRNAKESMVFNDKTFTKRVLFTDKNVLSFILNLKARQALPSHKHENSTVILIVLSGKGEVRVNEEDERVEKDSVIQASGEDDFSIPVVNEDMSLFVCVCPNPANQLFSKELG
jgi:quercetin dioxygenase-like cupin family protein